MKRSLLLLSLVFLIVFFYIPLLTIIRHAFILEGSFSLGNFSELISSTYHRHVITFTIKQAFISLLFTLLLGLPAAYIFTNFTFPGKQFLRPLMLVPFVLPNIIVALGFILLYGQNGYLNRLLSLFDYNIKILYRFEAIILAHSFYNFPIILKIVGDSWSRINKNYLAAAKTLGASKLSVFRRIVFPSLLPSIINASFLVFIYCFMSFGIVLILGSVKYTTIEVNIYYLTNNLFRFPTAMALGVIQLLFSSLFLLISQKTGRFSLRYVNLIENVKTDKQLTKLFSFKKNNLLLLFGKFTAISFMLLLMVVLIGPLFALVMFAVTQNSSQILSFNILYATLFTYNQIIGSNIAQTIFNSFQLAFLSGLFGVFLTFPFVWKIFRLEQSGRKRLASLFALLTIIPLFVSPVTFTLGYLQVIHLNQWHLNRFPLILAAHIIVALPFICRILLQGLRNIPINQIKTAHILGANSNQAFLHVIVPLIKNQIFIAFSFAFALSLGEFGGVMMLQRSYVTIPIAIYRFIGARRLINGVNMGLILLILTFVFFFIMEKLAKNKESRLLR